MKQLNHSTCKSQVCSHFCAQCTSQCFYTCTITVLCPKSSVPLTQTIGRFMVFCRRYAFVWEWILDPLPTHLPNHPRTDLKKSWTEHLMVPAWLFTGTLCIVPERQDTIRHSEPCQSFVFNVRLRLQSHQKRLKKKVVRLNKTRHCALLFVYQILGCIEQNILLGLLGDIQTVLSDKNPEPFNIVMMWSLATM